MFVGSIFAAIGPRKSSQRHLEVDHIQVSRIQEKATQPTGHVVWGSRCGSIIARRNTHARAWIMFKPGRLCLCRPRRRFLSWLYWLLVQRGLRLKQ